MKRILILTTLALFIISIAGCSNLLTGQQEQVGNRQEDPIPVEPSPSDPQADIPSLGGVSLGMLIKDVTDLLGENYTEQIEEDGGYFGEGIIIRRYQTGCDLVIGQTSGQVLQIDVFSADYPTNMGIKVGDPSIPAIKQYQGIYPEYIGNQSSEKLTGWFEIEPGILLIFSSRENRERINQDLTEDNKIYAITLGRAEYFD